MPKITSTTATTSARNKANATGDGARQGHSIMILLALHALMFAFIGVLGVYLQLKFPDVSPYETVYTTVIMDLVIIETCIYIVALVVMGILAARNYNEFEDLMNKLCFLLGSLSLILELIVLISPFGWILLFFWTIGLSFFLNKSYHELKILYQSAVEHLVPDFGAFRQTPADPRRSNAAADSLNISNDGHTTENQTQSSIIDNEGRATDLESLNNDRAASPQAQDWNHTNDLPV